MSMEKKHNNKAATRFLYSRRARPQKKHEATRRCASGPASASGVAAVLHVSSKLPVFSDPRRRHTRQPCLLGTSWAVKVTPPNTTKTSPSSHPHLIAFTLRVPLKLICKKASRSSCHPSIIAKPRRGVGAYLTHHYTTSIIDHLGHHKAQRQIADMSSYSWALPLCK